MATFLTYFLGTIAVISAILLICVIMIQQTKSGGGLGAVSGGVTESVFGTSAANVLTKITTWLAVVFLASTLLLGTVIGRMKSDNTSVAEKLLETGVTESQTVPAEATKPAEAAKEEAKPAEAAKEEAKPAEAAKEEAKPAEAPAK
ncbi:MAG: preprotein translocase subunit SecG [Victivallales bacterium]|nr:preprotein translocase subunit SecG [Victivallales bacterium]